MKKVILCISLLIICILCISCQTQSQSSDTELTSDSISECSHEMVQVYNLLPTCYSEGCEILQCSKCFCNEQIVHPMTEHSMVSSERQKGDCSTPTIIDYNCDNEGCFYHYSEEHIEDHNFYTKNVYKGSGRIDINAICYVCSTTKLQDIVIINKTDMQTIACEHLKLQDKVLVRACQHYSNYYEVYINGNWECKKGLETYNYQTYLDDSTWIATLSPYFGQTNHPTELTSVEEYLQTYMINN